MKKLLILSLVLVAFSFSAEAQKFASVDKSPLDLTILRENRNAAPIAKIYYSRPQLNGRGLDLLVPSGKVWRLGANEATEIVLNQDLVFGGKKLAKGRYTMFAVPSVSSWTIIFNSDTDAWGAYSYDEKKDVFRVEAPTSASDKIAEAFSIDFNYADKKVYFGWGNVVAALPFSM